MKKIIEDYCWYLSKPTSYKLPPQIVFRGTFTINALPLLGLTPGDKVNQIGFKVGGSAAVNREDYFKTYVEYAGVRVERMGDSVETLLMFKVRQSEVDGADEPIYLGYIVIEADGIIELKVPCLKTNTNRIFKPYFKLYNNEELHENTQKSESSSKPQQ